MTTTLTRPVSPLTVAKNRWDEATRVTEAYKIQLLVRSRRAYASQGKPWELQAWADVAEVEGQLEAAERAEVRASQEVAWEQHRLNQKREAGWLRGH